ncbi:MAG: hypothetical protein ACTHK3_10940 [Solirubrobacterales bacterium]
MDHANQVRRELANSGGKLAAAVSKQLDSCLDLLAGPTVTDCSKEGLLAQLNPIEGQRRTHKFPLKTMKVFSRYQNIGEARVPFSATSASGSTVKAEQGGL